MGVVEGQEMDNSHFKQAVHSVSSLIWNMLENKDKPSGKRLNCYGPLNYYVTQVWWFETSKPGKQSFCSNVSEELCRKDFGVSLKFAECDPCWWLFTWQSYQPHSSIHKQQVILHFVFQDSHIASHFYVWYNYRSMMVLEDCTLKLQVLSHLSSIQLILYTKYKVLAILR